MMVATASRKNPGSLLLWFFFTRNLLKVTDYYVGIEEKFIKMDLPPQAIRLRIFRYRPDFYPRRPLAGAARRV